MTPAKPKVCAAAPDYDLLAGKPGPAARLLRCIHEHAAAKPGAAWCPLPRRDVLRETRLSLDQYHRALRRLRGLRLVSDRMGYFKAVRMPHFKLLRPLDVPLDAPVSQPGGTELSVQEIAFQGGETPTLDEASVQPAAFQGGETPTISRGHACACAHPGLVSKKEKKVSKKVSKTSVRSHAMVEEVDVKQDFGKGIAAKQGKSVAQVVAESKAKQDLPGKPGLEAAWRDGYAQAFACFVPSLTVKERAQLRYFAKGCPDEAPPAAVLGFVLGHWPVFAAMAAHDAGAYSLPAKPHVGFLAKHLGIAVNLWLAEQKPAKPAPAPAPQAAPAAGPQAPAQPLAKTLAKPAAPEAKATLAEVLAILGQ